MLKEVKLESLEQKTHRVLREQILNKFKVPIVFTDAVRGHWFVEWKNHERSLDQILHDLSVSTPDCKRMMACHDVVLIPVHHIRSCDGYAFSSLIRNIHFCLTLTKPKTVIAVVTHYISEKSRTDLEDQFLQHKGRLQIIAITEQN